MPDDVRNIVPTVLNDQRERVLCPDYYASDGTCQRMDGFYCEGCPDTKNSPTGVKQSPTGRTIRPLTEGYVHKGGHNAFPSQVTVRPPPPAPVKLADVDYAQVEMRILFMAGWDACFAKRENEGSIPPNADDRADAQKSFEEFVKNYGNRQ